MYIDYLQELQEIKDTHLFVYPITVDNRVHNSQNDIVGLIVIECNTNKEYIIGITHPETYQQTLDYSFFKDRVVYCYNKSLFKYKKLIK